jgi:PTS system mannose-specific IIC component
MLTPALLTGLLVWGTIVGLDLVSVPQGMLSRPLVAGTIAGLILGDVQAGLRLGVVMELFALDVLPVGSSWYPDYGPPTVGMVVAMVGAPWAESLGVVVAVTLALSGLGGWTLGRLRHANGRAIRAEAAALAAAERGTVDRLQYGGLTRDAIRSLALTVASVLAALLVRGMPPLESATTRALLIVTVGTGLGAALHGAMRNGSGLPWMLRLAVSLGVGASLAALG